MSKLGKRLIAAAKEARADAAPVARDNSGRFNLLFTSDRPHIPGGKLAPLSMRSTRKLIADRLVTKSSGNIFADLGLPDAERLLAEADEKISKGDT